MHTIFTDGARDGAGFGGWAWVADTGEHDSGGLTNTSNNAMELTAVIRALADDRFADAPVRIVTDSAYVSNCFLEAWHETWRDNGWRNGKKKPVANRELWEELLAFVESRRPGCEVTWFHIRGHGRRASDPGEYQRGNREADRLAVQARKDIRFLRYGGVA